MGFLAALPAIASVAGSVFGKDKGGRASPQGIGGQENRSGFAALPEQVQNAYLNQYLPAALAQYNKGGTPLAPLNPAEQQAYSMFGQGLSGLQQQLPQYQDLYNQQVFNPYYQNLYNQNVLEPQLAEINEQQAIARSGLNGANMRSGNLGNPYSSAFGGQLAGLQEAANRMKLQARQNAFQNAYGMGQNVFQSSLGLRRQTLAEMLAGGGGLREYQQQQLAQPQARLAEFGQNLAAFPGSQTGVHYGQTPSNPNMLSKIGGAGLQLLGMGQSMGWNGFGGNGGFGGGGNQGFQNYQFGGPGFSGNSAFPMQVGNLNYSYR